MSNILNHNDNEKKGNVKNKIGKEVRISVSNVSRKDAGFVDEDNISPTFDVNMRINNHTRNSVLSLAKISGDKITANTIISELIDDHIKTLNDQELNLYEELLETFEQKDKLSYQLKKQK